MGILNKLFGGNKTQTAHKNDTTYILSRLRECKNSSEEIDLINSLLDGPKFMVFFDNADDALRFAGKVSYYGREGTLTFGRPISDGVYVFTGGRISNDEALAVFNAIRAPGSNQKRAVFYGWDPPKS